MCCMRCGSLLSGIVDGDRAFQAPKLLADELSLMTLSVPSSKFADYCKVVLMELPVFWLLLLQAQVSG